MSGSTYASPGPVLKRQRSDLSDTAKIADDSNVITRSDIWFDDGNIILQAQMTQFRVHRGIVGRHSSIFRDMFAMPQPSGEPVIEGCPIVHLLDRPQDWQNLLTILYDSSLKAYKSLENVTYSMLEAMLRLGTKYEFDHLRDLALECLQVERPRSLDLWAKKYDKRAIRTDTNRFHNFDFLNLLVDSGMTSLLPTALYACIEDHSLEEIVRGTIRTSGTSVHLPLNTQIRLALGKEKLLFCTTTYVQEWLASVEGCCDPLTCGHRKAGFLAIVLRQPFPPRYAISPFLLTIVRDTAAFCKVCKPVVINKIMVGRERIWDELPGYFGLPEWADLKDT